MKTFLQVADQYYVLATSVLADREIRVLKQGETFAIFDSYGDIQPVTHSESGIFHRGTRHLSKFEFMIWGDQRPLLLNSILRDDNGLLKVDMTNRDMERPGVGFIPKGTLYIHREKFLFDSTCFEKVTITNYGPVDVKIDAAYRIDADFADIFEVRGTKREQRGTMAPFRQTGRDIRLVYTGLDRITRTTVISFLMIDVQLDGDMTRFDLTVPARGGVEFHVKVSLQQEHQEINVPDYMTGIKCLRTDHIAGRDLYCTVRTSNEQFDNWMRRSTDDLVMMTTKTESGFSYPYAGIPWFCAPFGRDGIITALQVLWANAGLAKGVLHYLARTQARDHVVEQDCTPGKIIHEVRAGEMAALKEIPFGQYYGSIDSTPLFVCLGGEYLTRTNDLETVRSLWPHFERALLWMERYGDLDGDGFLEYQRESRNGLVQQGWKDSHDSVFHADGSEALGPIALCEVQGYAYKAYREGAKMAEALGHRDFALAWRERALDLKERFDQAFWLEDMGTYALALDGDKRACRVLSSNAGQCLFTRIVKSERAERLVKTLMAPESFGGWGVRTIATSVERYNPMSYHNGSVWPHDVSLIAWGMSKYGFKDEVERLFNGLFRAATYMELMRMPEVFCGFERSEGEAPTLYPHACSPQAWAAASVYLLLQAMLGITIDANRKCVWFRHPRLSDSIETLKISGLPVGDGRVDLIVQNYHSDVSVQLGRRSAGITVSVEK